MFHIFWKVIGPLKRSKIVELRQKFNELPNAVLLSDRKDVIEVISVSDIVVTNCFSSPTADALLAGVPAFWYQARTDVSFSIYNEVPGLIVRGYKNLVLKINELISDEYSLDILDDSDFIHLVGPTGKALTSLRLQLSNE